jgi:hypothetical protein
MTPGGVVKLLNPPPGFSKSPPNRRRTLSHLLRSRNYPRKRGVPNTVLGREPLAVSRRPSSDAAVLPSFIAHRSSFRVVLLAVSRRPSSQPDRCGLRPVNSQDGWGRGPKVENINRKMSNRSWIPQPFQVRRFRLSSLSGITKRPELSRAIIRGRTRASDALNSKEYGKWSLSKNSRTR